MNVDEEIEIASERSLKVEEFEDILLGYEFATQRIDIDFNYGPTFKDSLNWVDSDGNLKEGVNKFTKDSDYKYHIIGTSGQAVYTSFDAGTFPMNTRGSGNHVELPDFDKGENAVWEGYKFEYFYDKDGRNMTAEAAGNFDYSYQGSGDNTYTANWSKVNTAYNFVIDYVTQKPGEEEYKSLFKSTASIVHGKNVAEQHIDLLGYNFNKIDYFVPSEGVATSSNILLTYDNKKYTCQYIYRKINYS